MKILIIEDEPSIASSIKAYLEKEDATCEVAQDFEKGIKRAVSDEYDCILVDLTLPGGNGLDIIATIKEEHVNTGVIIISAKNSIYDKVTGLELGADDYMTKPFHLSELNARIKALIRRKQFAGNTEIRFHDITLNLENKDLRVGNTTVPLTRSEFRLIEYFMANQNRVVSKESIASHLSGNQIELLDEVDFVYSHIKNLRKKLVQAGAPYYLKAVYGMGYKFSVT